MTKDLRKNYDNAWPFPKAKPDEGPEWPFPVLPRKNSALLEAEWPFPTERRNKKIPLTVVDAATFIQEKDPNGKPLNSMGAKGDGGKDRAWLCLCGFSNALAAVAKVTTFGANKYTPGGWVEVPDASNRYMDAFARHMLKFGSNEIMDEDSKCKHLAQMIWNLLAVLELEERAANPNTGKPWPKEYNESNSR